MGEGGRELYGLDRSPDNSLMVVCGGEVVVTPACNVVALDDVAATIDVATVNGVVVVAVIVFWV